jgi:hypothetical protein
MICMRKEQVAMLIEPEFLIVFAIVLALTSAVWSTSQAKETRGPSWPHSLVVSAPVPSRPSARAIRSSSPQSSPRRNGPAKKPTLLAASPVTVAHPVPPVARALANTVEPVTASTDTRLSSATQVSRLTNIVQTGVETAQTAGRLHRQAHEQVDAAHYALQNLLAELTIVMPVAAPAVTASTVTFQRPAPTRPVYHTALAA